METFSALLALCAGNSPVPVNSPHKGQWRGALMFTLICAGINDWVNNREAGDLRRHLDHYDVSVMRESTSNNNGKWLVGQPLRIWVDIQNKPMWISVHRISHWGRVMHICVSNQTRPLLVQIMACRLFDQAIIWANAGCLLIETNICDNSVKCNHFQTGKLILKCRTLWYTVIATQGRQSLSPHSQKAFTIGSFNSNIKYMTLRQ